MQSGTKRIFGVLAMVALLTPCQCSFLFDLGDLRTGGADGVDDASGDDGQDASANSPDDTPPLGLGTDGGDDEGTTDATMLDAAPGTASDSGSAPDTGRAPDTDPVPDGAAVPDTGAMLDASAREASAAADAGETTEAGQGAGAADGAHADAANEGGADAAAVVVPVRANDAGLVALYQFGESSGTLSADGSGNGETATMVGATFSAGVQGNAATMDGTSQYVALAPGIVNGLSDFSVCAWVNLNAPVAQHEHIFDFGTGSNDYMFLTPNAGTGVLQFAISTGGVNTEQMLNGTAPLPSGTWQHICVTLSHSTGVLYVGGAPVDTNAAMTLNPSSLGAVTQDWLGRSRFADPFFSGKIDQFRIYNRALSAAEVLQLFTQLQ
jgi:concanavalin A-like lectin/glucanase superfamily protein